MAVSLVGEVVNTADATTGFNVGNINADDDFVQGTGAIGLKISAAASEMYTTTLGVTAPYDFSSVGAESGYHIVMWFNSKSPINATAGFRIIVGNGVARGHWNVVPAGFYKGGFITRVVNTARPFDSIPAGTWTTGATVNPGQLSAITQMGGLMQTASSIMGTINNLQLDQFTIGLGLRVSGGTSGVPDTFEAARLQDEDTSKWGWWGSSNGAIIGKGKLYIGPPSGNAASVFNDSTFVVIFADEKVSSSFYEINARGTGTTVSWDLASISAANSTNARWGLTLDSTLGSFSDKNGVWTGAGNLYLNSNAGLTGTTLVDCSKLYQSGATLNGCTVIAANTSAGTAFIESGNPGNISNCKFTFSAGHAIELTSQSATAVTFTKNFFTNYQASGTTGAAVYNNSGKAITINVVDGDSPTVRNGAGSTTTVVNSISLTLTNIINDSEVRIYSAGTINELAGEESVTSGSFTYSYTYAAGVYVDIVVYKKEYTFNEPEGRLSSYLLTSSTTSIPISQKFDRNYLNP